MTHMLRLFSLSVYCLLCFIALLTIWPDQQHSVSAIGVESNLTTLDVAEGHRGQFKEEVESTMTCSRSNLHEDYTKLMANNDYSNILTCANNVNEDVMRISSMCSREGGCPHSAMVWASGTFTLANLLSPMTFANASEISLTLQLSLCCNYLFNGKLLTPESSSEMLYVEFIKTLLHSSPFAKLSMEEQLQLFPRDRAVLYNSRQNKTFRLSTYLEQLSKRKEWEQLEEQDQKMEKTTTVTSPIKLVESEYEHAEIVNTVKNNNKNDAMDGDVLILQTGTLHKESIALLQKYLLDTQDASYGQELFVHSSNTEENKENKEHHVDGNMWHGISNMLLPVSSSLRANSLQLHITNKVLKCKCPHTLLVQPLLFMKPYKLANVVSINGVGSHCAPFTLYNISSNASSNASHYNNNKKVNSSVIDNKEIDMYGSTKENENNCNNKGEELEYEIKSDNNQNTEPIKYKHYCYATNFNNNTSGVNMSIACRAQFTLSPPLLAGTHIVWTVSEVNRRSQLYNYNVSSDDHSLIVQGQKNLTANLSSYVDINVESNLLNKRVIFHEETLPLCRVNTQMWKNRDTIRVAKSPFFDVLPNKEYIITVIVTRGVRDHGNNLYNREFVRAEEGEKQKQQHTSNNNNVVYNKTNGDNVALYTIQRRTAGRFILRLPFKQLLNSYSMQQQIQGAHSTALLELPHIVPAQPHFGLSRRMSLTNFSLELMCSTIMSEIDNTQTHLHKRKVRGNAVSDANMDDSNNSSSSNVNMFSYDERKAFLDELIQNYEMYWEIQESASHKEQTRLYVNRTNFVKTCLRFAAISETNVSITESNNDDNLESNSLLEPLLLELPPSKNVISFFVQDVDHVCDRVEVERHEVWAFQSVITIPTTSPITVCENNTFMALLSLSETLADMRARTKLPIYLSENVIVPVKQLNVNRTEGTLLCTKLSANSIYNEEDMKKQDDTLYNPQWCELLSIILPSFTHNKKEKMAKADDIYVNVSLNDKGVYEVRYVVSFRVTDHEILHKVNFDEHYAKLVCTWNNNSTTNDDDIVNNTKVNSTGDWCIVQVFSPRVLFVRRLSAYPRIVKIQLPMHATQWTLSPPSPHPPNSSSPSSSLLKTELQQKKTDKEYVKQHTDNTPLRGRWFAGNTNIIRIALVDEKLHVTLDTRKVPNIVQQLPWHTVQLFIYDEVGEDLLSEYGIDYVARCPEPFVVEYEMNVIALPVVPFEPNHEIIYTEEACLRLSLPLTSTRRKGDHVHWRAVDCSMNHINTTPILLLDEDITRKEQKNARNTNLIRQSVTHYTQANQDEPNSIMVCAIVPYSHCVVELNMFNIISSTVFSYHLRRCQLPPNLLFASTLPLLRTNDDEYEVLEWEIQKRNATNNNYYEEFPFFTSLPIDVIHHVSCRSSTRDTVTNNNMSLDNLDDTNADNAMECAIYNSHEEQVIIPITTSSSTQLEQLSSLKLYYEYNTTSAHNVHLHVLHTDFVPLFHLASSQLEHTQAFVDNTQEQEELLLTVTLTNHNKPYKGINNYEKDMQESNTCNFINNKSNNNESTISEINATVCNEKWEVDHTTFTHHVSDKSIEFSHLESSVLIPLDYSVYSASPQRNNQTISPAYFHHLCQSEDNTKLSEENVNINTSTISKVLNATHHLVNINQSDSRSHYYNNYQQNYEYSNNEFHNNGDEMEFAVRGLCRRYHGLISLFHLQPRGVLNVDARYNLSLFDTKQQQEQGLYGVIPVCSNSYHFARHPSLSVKYGFSFLWSCNDDSGSSHAEINVQTISPTESRLTFDALHKKSPPTSTSSSVVTHSGEFDNLLGAYCRLTVFNHFTHTNASERVFVHRVFTTSSQRAIVVLSNNTVTDNNYYNNTNFNMNRKLDSTVSSFYELDERHDTIKTDRSILQNSQSRHTKSVNSNTPQIIRVIGKSVILHVDDVFMSSEEQFEFDYTPRRNNTHGWKVESIVTNKQMNVGTQYLIDQVHITRLYQHPTSLHRARVRVNDALVQKDDTSLRSTSYFTDTDLHKKYIHLQSKHAKADETVDECEGNSHQCKINSNNKNSEYLDEEEVVQAMVESVERRGSTVLISNLHTPGLYTISFTSNDPVYPNECAKMQLTITLEVFHASLLTSPTVVICGNEATLHALPLPRRYQHLLTPTTLLPSSKVSLSRTQQQKPSRGDAHTLNEKTRIIYTKWEVISVQDAPHHTINVSSNSHDDDTNYHESDLGIEFSNATNSPSTVISHLPFGVITVQWSIYKQVMKNNVDNDANINKMTHSSSFEQSTSEQDKMYEDILLDSARTRLLVLVDSIDIERIVTLNSYITLPITSSTVNWSFAQEQQEQELSKSKSEEKKRSLLRGKEKEAKTANLTLLPPLQIRQELFNQGKWLFHYFDDHEDNVEHRPLQTSSTGVELYIQREQNSHHYEQEEYEEYEQSRYKPSEQSTSHSFNLNNEGYESDTNNENNYVHDNGSDVLTLTSLPIGVTTLQYNLVPSQNIFGEMVEYSKKVNCSLTSYLHVERIAALVSASVANMSHECDLYSGAAEITLCVHAEQLSAQQSNRRVDYETHKTVKHKVTDRYSNNSSNDVKSSYTEQVKLIPLTEIERVMKYDAKRLLNSEVHTLHNAKETRTSVQDMQILPWWIRESSTWENIHYVHNNTEEQTHVKKNEKDKRGKLHKSVLSSSKSSSPSSLLSQQCIRFNVYSNVHLSHKDVESNMFALNLTSLIQKKSPLHRRGSASSTTSSTTLALHMFITSRIIEGSEVAYDVHQGKRHRSVIHTSTHNSPKGRTDNAMFGSWRKLFSFTQHEAQQNSNQTRNSENDKNYWSSPYHRDKIEYLPLLNEHTWQPIEHHLRALKPNDKHITLESISELVFSGDVAHFFVKSNWINHAEKHETSLQYLTSTQEQSYYSFELEQSPNTIEQNASTHRNKITLLLDWSAAGFLFTPADQMTNSSSNNNTKIKQESLLDKCVSGNLKGKDIFQKEWIDSKSTKQVLHSHSFTKSPSETHQKHLEKEYEEELQWTRYVDGVADAHVNCTLLFRSLSKVLTSSGTLTRAAGKATLDKLKEQMRQRGLKRTSDNINALLYFRPEPSLSLSNSTPSAPTEHTEEEQEVQNLESENYHYHHDNHTDNEIEKNVNVTLKRVESNMLNTENANHKYQENKNTIREHGYITANVLRQQLDSLERHLRYTIDGIEVSGLRTSLQRALSTRRITRAQLDEIIAFRRAHQTNVAQGQEESTPRQLSYVKSHLNSNYEQETSLEDKDVNNSVIGMKVELESLLQRYEAALQSLFTLTQHDSASSSSSSSSSSSTIPRLPSSSSSSTTTAGATRFISNAAYSTHIKQKEQSWSETTLQEQMSSNKWKNEVFALEIEIPSFPEFAIKRDMQVHKRVAKNSICGNSLVKTHNVNSLVNFGPLEIIDVPPQFILNPLKVKQCEVEGAMPPITINVIGDRFSTEQMHSSHWLRLMRQINLHEVIAIANHTVNNNVSSENKHIVSIKSNMFSSNEVIWQHVPQNYNNTDKKSENVGLAPCIDLFKEQLQIVINTNTTKQLTILLGNCPFLQMLAPEEYNNPSSSSLSSSSSTSEKEFMERLRTPRFLEITLPSYALQHVKQKEEEKLLRSRNESFEFVVQVNPTLARLYLPISTGGNSTSEQESNENEKISKYNRKNKPLENVESTNVFEGNYKRPLVICESKLKKEGMLLGVELVGDTWTHHVGVNSATTSKKETNKLFFKNSNNNNNNSYTTSNNEHNVHHSSSRQNSKNQEYEETINHNWSYESAQNIALLNSFSAASRPAHSLVTNIPMLSRWIKQEEQHNLQQHKLMSVNIKRYEGKNDINEVKSDFIDYLYNALFTRLYHRNEYEHELVHEHKYDSSSNAIYELPHNELVHKYNDSFISIFFPPITSTYMSDAFTKISNNMNTNDHNVFFHTNYEFVTNNNNNLKNRSELSLLPSIRPFHRVEEIVFAIPGIATECQGCLLADSNLYVAGDLTGIWSLQYQERSVNRRNGVGSNTNNNGNHNSTSESSKTNLTKTCTEPNCVLWVSLESLIKPEQRWNLRWLCEDAAVNELHSLTSTMLGTLPVQYTEYKQEEECTYDNKETTCNSCNKARVNSLTSHTDKSNAFELYMSLVLYHGTDNGNGKGNAAVKVTSTLLNKNTQTWKTSNKYQKPRARETVYKITLLQSELVNVTEWLQTWERCMSSKKEKYENDDSNDNIINNDIEDNENGNGFNANSVCNRVQFNVQSSTINNDVMTVLHNHWPKKQHEIDAYVELHLCAPSVHSLTSTTPSAKHTTELKDKFMKQCMLVSETAIKLYKPLVAKRSFTNKWLRIRSLLTELKQFAQIPAYNKRHTWKSSLHHMYITTPLHLLHALLFFIVLPFIIPLTCLPFNFGNSNDYNNNDSNYIRTNTQSPHYLHESDSIRNFATSWFLFALYLTSLYYPWLYFVTCGLLWAVYLYLSERLQAYLLFMLTAIYWYYTLESEEAEQQQ